MSIVFPLLIPFVSSIIINDAIHGCCHVNHLPWFLGGGFNVNGERDYKQTLYLYYHTIDHVIPIFIPLSSHWPIAFSLLSRFYTIVNIYDSVVYSAHRYWVISQLTSQWLSPWYSHYLVILCHYKCPSWWLNHNFLFIIIKLVMLS